MIGTTVDQYRIMERIGGGGMGEVYRAVDLELERDVAIKCVRPELSDIDEVTQRFRNEARTLARLSHLNIATVHRFFREDDRLFLVMEYIAGEPFGSRLQREGALSPDDAVALIIEALNGLGYAHQNNVVHRDIKPGNLMVDGDGTVKVLDFGIAHLVDGTRLTRAGGVVGTPAYMAPEQILGKPVDQRTDLYSLGIVLYEMLSGELPFEALSDFELMRSHIEEKPRSLEGLANRQVPTALRDTVEKSLAKDSNDRFQTANDFSAALAEVVDDRTVILPPPPSVTSPPPPPPPQGNSAGGAAAAGGAGGGSGTAAAPATDAGATDNKTSWVWLGGAAALLVALLGWATFTGDTPEPVKTPTTTQTTTQTSPADNLGQTQPLTQPVQTEGGTETVSQANSETEVAQAADAGASDPSGAAPTTVTAAPPPVQRATSQPVVRAAPRPTTSSAAPRVTPVKVSAHERQGVGRFSRNAGYNGAFRLRVPSGTDRVIEITEVVVARRAGVEALRTEVTTTNRTAGTFKTKQRVQGLKDLDPGTYDLTLMFLHKGRQIGTHSWRLDVGG